MMRMRTFGFGLTPGGIGAGLDVTSDPDYIAGRQAYARASSLPNFAALFPPDSYSWSMYWNLNNHLEAFLEGKLDIDQYRDNIRYYTQYLNGIGVQSPVIAPQIPTMPGGTPGPVRGVPDPATVPISYSPPAPQPTVLIQPAPAPGAAAAGGFMDEVKGVWDGLPTLAKIGIPVVAGFLLLGGKKGR